MRRNVTRQISLAAALAIAVWTPAQANADVLTFDSQTVGQVAPDTVITEGLFSMFAFGGASGNTMTIKNIGGTHQNVVIDGNPTDSDGTVFSIFLTDGGLFSLNSIDIANLRGGQSNPISCGFSFRIELTDNLGDCSAFSPATFVTVSPPGFQNISALFVNIVSHTTIANNFDFAIDNINLSPSVTAAPAPEPSTVLLVCAGLAYVSCGRRKLTALRRGDREGRWTGRGLVAWRKRKASARSYAFGTSRDSWEPVC